MKKRDKVSLILIALIIIQFTPPLRLPQNMIIMSVYSIINNKKSIMSDENFSISIPGGLKTKDTDWFPFVMTFNDDDGFKEFEQNPNLRLTIMYNFPAFSLKDGCSRIYDINSPYYNSFYGAYIVQDTSGNPYGFNNSNNSLVLDTQSIANIPKHDLQNLVLSDFGLNENNMIFDWNIVDNQDNISYIGYNNWYLTNAEITVNGIAHNKKDFVQSYLQYGSPSSTTINEFKPIKMKGRVYSRYFEEYNCSIFLYVITSDADVLENCDNELLSKIVISEKQLSHKSNLFSHILYVY